MALAKRLALGGLVVIGLSQPAIARQATPASATPASAIAFVNVNVISMDTARADAGQTVLVQGDRIVGRGARADVPIPTGATVIDGGNRYLVPGLIDAHVHLSGDGTGVGSTRPDFRDGPLYLAHGVTTVFNLGGTPVHLDWRRRIETGQLIGPTIYTAGAFVNEPRVSTVADVEREIRTQAHDGYDLIKFHEIYVPGAGDVTASGLSRAAYLRMNEVAREIGIPLVGHAPVHLGLDVLLEARQPLAHMGMLSNIYFLPMVGDRSWVITTALAIIVLMVIAVTGPAAAILRTRRASARRPRQISRVPMLACFALLACVLAGTAGAMLLPGGPFFESVELRWAFTLVVLAIAAVTVNLLILTAALWRDPRRSLARRIEAMVASVASVTLVGTACLFWVPVVWRSSDGGIAQFATRLHDAGISVQTTLVVYDAIGGPDRIRLVNDPALRYLRADVQERWRRFPSMVPSSYRYTGFMKKVTGALYRAGVPLIAGTDAMGYPLVTPGSSLHRELALLVESGLTPHEALRAATVAPATFLRKQQDFGTIATGMRADLLLIDGNPLEDVGCLKRPVGVMARGRWFPQAQLQAMLTALAEEP